MLTLIRLVAVLVLFVLLITAVAGLRIDLKPDLDAGVLVLDRLKVDVLAAVVASGAGPESGRAVIGELAALNVETGVGFGANIALLLRGGRCQDAATVLAIVNAWEVY